MNNNNGNVITQLVDAVSQMVTEIPYDAVVQIMDRQINRLIAFDENLRNVRFGQSERWFADGQRAVNNRRHRMNKIKWFAIGVLLIAFGLGVLGYYCLHLKGPSVDTKDRSTNDTPMFIPLDDNHQDLEMKEENNLFCANPTAEDNLDEEIIDSVTYNEPNIASMFQATSTTDVVDDSTYNIIGVIQTESQDDIYSICDDNIVPFESSLDDNKQTSLLGQTLPTSDDLCASKIEQNGADSTEDACSTQLHTPKEMSPLNPNEEFVEKDVT